jgi:hypothetical protein
MTFETDSKAACDLVDQIIFCLVVYEVQMRSVYEVGALIVPDPAYCEMPIDLRNSRHIHAEWCAWLNIGHELRAPHSQLRDMISNYTIEVNRRL